MTNLQSQAAQRQLQTNPAARNGRNAAPTDTVGNVLELGSLALGLPLEFLPERTGTHPRPRRSAAAFAEEVPVIGASGETLGQLRAAGIVRRPPFEPAERILFEATAALIAEHLRLRDGISETDHVTLLPNRQKFLRDIERLDAESEERPARLLILVTLADARHFNEILRALGHAFSEDLVRLGAKTVRGLVSPVHTLYHVSVLSLAFIVDRPVDDSVPPVVLDIVKRFTDPLVCQQIPVAIRAGVGITPLLPGRSGGAEALRLALTAAQDSRHFVEGYARYDRSSDERHRRAFMLLADLRSALSEGRELSMNYQPRLDMRAERYAGAESLLRWTHPTFGPVAPGEFIPLAETTALMTPLTRWVLDAVVRQGRAWQAAGLDLKLSANVSPANLREPGFVEDLIRLLRDNGIRPDRFELEFTESAIVTDEKRLFGELQRLRDAGVDVAIDDFGSGYSNMSYLTRLPANVVKIDRSFVQSLSSDAKNRILVKAMLDIGHSLGLRVVTEGIETAADLELIRSWGSDEGQGYHLARPMPAETFERWLRAKKPGIGLA